MYRNRLLDYAWIYRMPRDFDGDGRIAILILAGHNVVSFEAWELNPSTLLDPTTLSQIIRAQRDRVPQDVANYFGLRDL